MLPLFIRPLSRGFQNRRESWRGRWGEPLFHSRARLSWSLGHIGVGRRVALPHEGSEGRRGSSQALLFHSHGSGVQSAIEGPPVRRPCRRTIHKEGENCLHILLRSMANKGICSSGRIMQKVRGPHEELFIRILAPLFRGAQVAPSLFVLGHRGPNTRQKGVRYHWAGWSGKGLHSSCLKGGGGAVSIFTCLISVAIPENAASKNPTAPPPPNRRR